jgi:hypothetical protein
MKTVRETENLTLKLLKAMMNDHYFKRYTDLELAKLAEEMARLLRNID